MVCIDPFLGELKIDLPKEERSITLREFSPNHNKTYIPNEKYLETTQGLTKKSYQLHVDENGFIIGDNQDKFKKSTDIIFFGGSTTECIFVEEKLRFPYLVGKKLKDSSNNNLHSLNGGKSGNNSMHSTLKLLAKGIPLKPKVVVLMHNINDLSVLAYEENYWNGPFTRAIVTTKENTIKSSMKDIVKILVKKFVPNLYSKIKIRNFDEWKGSRKYNLNSYEQIEKSYDQSISSFIRLAKTYNIDVVLMTQANRFNKNDQFINTQYDNGKNLIDFKTYCDYYCNLNQKIRDIAARENVLLIDLEKLIPANKNFIYDAVHLNTEGSKLAANIISDEFAKQFHFYNRSE